MTPNDAPHRLTEAVAEPRKAGTTVKISQGDLSQAETDRLQQLETVIHRGKQAFIEVGVALMEVRESRLYRSEFNTFEEYCSGKWGFNRNFANKMIVSSDLARDLGTIVPIPNEGTAREFVSVPKEDRPAVAEEAKAIAAKQGRDTINSRDVKEAKVRRKAGPTYHCTECDGSFTESEGDCPRCHPPEPETVEFVPADDPGFDEDGFQTLCGSFRQSIFDARIGWPRKHLIRLEVEVSNMFHCGIPAAAPLVAGGEV